VAGEARAMCFNRATRVKSAPEIRIKRLLPRPIGTLVTATALCCISVAAEADSPPTADTPTPDSSAVWAPSVAPLLGVGVPISGASLGLRVGLKAAIADLSAQTPGLQFIVPLAFTFEGQITGGEVAAGFEYGRSIGSGALAWYADLTFGYRHDHQVVPTRFLGYQVVAGNFFVARLEGAIAYRFSKSVRAFLEPINFGVYRGSGTAIDWAPQLGAEFRI
jgi:hypothetical protein